MISFPSGVSQITLPSQGIYRPEAYGPITGTDPADGVYVQAAIDAAVAAGAGATVRLDQTYAYTDGTLHGAGGLAYIGPYQATVGLWLNGSGITVDGNNTGVLKLSAAPVYTASYIGFLVGNGGYDHIPPGTGTWDEINSSGTWTEDVVVKNLDFDNSVLDDAGLAAITGTLCGVLIFAFCKNSTQQNLHADKVYGGGLMTHCSSSHNTIDDLTVDYAYQWGFWLDGCEGSTISNLTCSAFSGLEASEAGFICATNQDYDHGSSHNAITNIVSLGGKGGIGGIGEYSTIDGATISIAAGTTTKVAISLSTRNDSPIGCWWHHDCEITNVTVTRASGTGTIFGVELIGTNSALIDGLPRECSDNNIHHNHFLATGPAYALVLNVQASRNTFVHNEITASVSADVSGGTAVDNVLTPNP